MYILIKKVFDVEEQTEKVQYFTGTNTFVLGECHYGLSDSIEDAFKYPTKEKALKTIESLKKLTVFPVSNNFECQKI